ncbi:ribosomal protein L7Ae-like RNA K-turn-binding protein [Clostridium algifaecis]|uniref:Ribosomal protein L7Ae-like RNA K-turn-binding protein n=1 Tax=Clostridium algifaecis TaxID=1472040 RepID=A0ABS4KNP5_9CLOT|nr:ribosomal L7Ae/L30e/S12e/Gadd45 family protein [Clostridium algifaecis]MBP2031668.1 ribosomal protein L7Ae-like RNA K-turn-binding protein [Clostridium algifaecis]
MKNKFLQFLGLAKRAGKILEGYNKCETNVKNNKIYLIIVSEDASLNTLNKFLEYGNKYNINVIVRCSKEELGSAIGLKEIKVIGIIDKNMSEKLIDIQKDKF